jgi:hypothetical protein
MDDARFLNLVSMPQSPRTGSPSRRSLAALVCCGNEKGHRVLDARIADGTRLMRWR